MADPTDPTAAPEPVPASEPTADAAGADPTSVSGKTFTQAEVDNILKDRLARQKAAVEGAAQKAKDEADRLAAEKQGEFEKLYKETLTKFEQAEARAKAAELARIKTTIGSKLALPAELQDRLRGETEEEIEADAKVLLAAIPKPTPVTNTDATSGVNGSQPTAQYTDEEIRNMAAEYGVKFEHLKATLVK
jgi:Domain of unknown function (DUF4355)